MISWTRYKRLTIAEYMSYMHRNTQYSSLAQKILKSGIPSTVRFFFFYRCEHGNPYSPLQEDDGTDVKPLTKLAVVSSFREDKGLSSSWAKNSSRKPTKPQ